MSVYVDDGTGYDYAIDNIPFLSALDKNNPHMRQSAETQKNRFDPSNIAGDQTLGFWWLRAQESFHKGAGQVFLDSTSQNNDSPFRFSSSENVYVWKPGQVSLLNGMVRADGGRFSGSDSDVAANPSKVQTLNSGVLFLLEGTLTAWRSDVAPTSATDYSGNLTQYPLLTSTILDFTTDGTNVWAASADGVFKWVSGAWVKVYDYAGALNPVLRYVKRKLVCLDSASGKGWSLDPTVNTTTVLPSQPFAILSGITFEAIAEAPNGILFSGFDGARSHVWNVTLDTSSAIPNLGAPAEAASLPPGERIRDLMTYLGTFVALVTSQGLRVGILSTTGDFTLPSLSITSPKLRAVTAGGDLLYVAEAPASSDDGGRAGLISVDLTQQSNDTGLFPYTSDLLVPDSSPPIGGVAVVRDGLVAVPGGFENRDTATRKVILAPSGLWVEALGQPNASGGTLTTSRIRFGTLEPKALRKLRIRGEGTTGSITANVVTDAGGTPDTVTIGGTGTWDSGEVDIPHADVEWCQINFELTGDATLTGFVLKGLPQPTKQRYIQLPLSCYDHEVSNNGLSVGYVGAALERLTAIEQLDHDNAVVTLQYLSNSPESRATEQCMIDSVSFQQLTGPGDPSGWGGVIQLTLRTVT